MLNALQDALSALKSGDPDDLKTAEPQSYLLSGFVIVFENPQKGWDSHLDSLKNLYADIFKFL